MEIVFKDKDQIVDEIVGKLRGTLPEFTDFTPGTVLRDIIESFSEELSYQYWQLEQTYNAGFIATAEDEDLDNLVELLGITRREPQKSIGEVIFYRETPADQDLYINVGNIVKTLPDENGISISFETTQNAILREGQTQVIVPIRSTEGGLQTNVSANTIRVMVTAPFGIDGVRNIEPTSGGEDRESNDDLKERAKHIFDTSGNSTVDALYYRMKIADGVREVTVFDMARGIGTADIYVLADTVPMSTQRRLELERIIYTTKASGIDVMLKEPDIYTLNGDIQVTLDEGYFLGELIEDIQAAIELYVNELDIGQTFIRNQLYRQILNISPGIIDVASTNIPTHITPNDDEVIRLGNITIT